MQFFLIVFLGEKTTSSHTLALIAELQDENRPFVIRFEVLANGDVQKVVEFLKLPGQPPIDVKDVTKSILDSCLAEMQSKPISR